ncbi:plus-3-domain-containing protein [Hesseltinella vesiculosa]|uniref:Plus-3-domain-containing protein n=1 Tax=Hesseltinella vesiculosa TaxID=101127 RepID=A0A1X2GPD6_9FUNG|nr:plus-3-domain-containing protein [Hesseltinella vesiculosa]
MDVDDFILKLADNDASKNSKRSKKYVSDSEDDQGFTDEDDMDVGSDDEIDEYGPDLYKDEDDRRRLLALPEVERERILSERSEERQRYLERLEVRKLLKGGRSREETTRRSTRAKGSSTSKALSELTRRREERKSDRSKRHRRYSPSPERRSRRRSNDEFDYNQSDEWSASEEEREDKSKFDFPSLEQIHHAGFTRQMMEQWMYAPFFEKTIVGSFVRLNLGAKSDRGAESAYRLCEVVAVKPYHKVYKMSNGVPCNQGLLLKHGKSEKVFEMTLISNQPVTKSEYDRYKNTLLYEKVRPPTVLQTENTLDAIKAAKSYVLNHEEVAAMVDRKKQVNGQNTNIAMERAEVLARLQHAQAHNHTADIRTFSQRLAELDALIDSRQDGNNHNNPQRVWEEINKRNREKDKIESQQVELKLSEERRKAMKLAIARQQQKEQSMEATSEDAAKLQSAVIVVANYEDLIRSAGKDLQITLLD